MKQKINNTETLWISEQSWYSELRRLGCHLPLEQWVSFSLGNRTLDCVDLFTFVTPLFLSHGVSLLLFFCFLQRAVIFSLGCVSLGEGKGENPRAQVHPRQIKENLWGLGPDTLILKSSSGDPQVFEDHISQCLIWLASLEEGVGLKKRGGG